MSVYPRIALAAMLFVGFSSIAQARGMHAAPADRGTLSEGRSVAVDVAVDRASPRVATVPPSESRTVMGLGVPH